MRRIDSLFREYAAFHTDRRNKLCHYPGITVILVAFLALLWQVRLGPVPVAVPVVALTVAFYAALDVPLALGAAIGFGALLALAPLVSWPLAIALFLGGWVLQFVGHAFERKKPAFARNPVHLAIGPLWILSHLYELAGLRRTAEHA
jgi:uncharacterized membrane protein YGL010W